LVLGTCPINGGEPEMKKKRMIGAGDLLNKQECQSLEYNIQTKGKLHKAKRQPEINAMMRVTSSVTATNHTQLYKAFYFNFSQLHSAVHAYISMCLTNTIPWRRYSILSATLAHCILSP
jgi:hypothetical protein